MQNVKNTSFVVGNPDGMKEREAFEIVKNRLIINEYKKNFY